MIPLEVKPEAPDIIHRLFKHLVALNTTGSDADRERLKGSGVTLTLTADEVVDIMFLYCIHGGNRDLGEKVMIQFAEAIVGPEWAEILEEQDA